MKRWMTLVLGAISASAIGMLLYHNWSRINVDLWQRQVSPGPLSPGHAWLNTNCAACHTPLKSADPPKCVGCHANNTALLKRQPTAFHATIGSCSSCHIEHQGGRARLTTMDHVALADIGLEVVRRNGDNPTNRRLMTWIRQHERAAEIAPTHPKVTSTEAALDCATCHSTKDQHQGMFGQDCASCHGTASWTIAEFRHPSPRSVQCVQCHQAPPSHYMMHFTMVSQRVARQPDARVDQCFACHQTTSWNDIRGVGWYKHH